MQLKPSGASVRAGLALAAASLLGPAARAQETRVETGILVYTEPDRVSALEGVTHLSRTFREDQTVSLRLVYDTLTGASPNGAVPSRRVQTFTRPSGRGSYQTDSRTTPLDDTFRDSRFAGSLGYERPFLGSTRVNLGLQGSSEHDYLSLGGSVGFVREFDRKNTALSAGLSLARDEVRPEGGAPLPFSEMGEATGGGEEDRPAAGRDPSLDPTAARGAADYPGEPGERLPSIDTKWIVDGVVGVTQVVDRTTLVRFNYSLSASSGYLTDPYKLLTVVGAPGGAESGEPLTYLYESRPGARHKHSLYGQARKRIGTTTFDLAYRYLWDTWGIVSHTGDLHVRFPVGAGYTLEPHVRVYRQSAADFHAHYLVDGVALPVHASADPRLGQMVALTVGAEVGGFHLAAQQFALTLEYYRQFLDGGEEEAFGQLEGLDLGEDLGAVLFRVTHGWSR